MERLSTVLVSVGVAVSRVTVSILGVEMADVFMGGAVSRVTVSATGLVMVVVSLGRVVTLGAGG